MKYNNPKFKYARHQLNKNHSCLISADEVAYFDKYLEAARNEDKGIIIDLEKADKKTPIIIAGALLSNSVPLNDAVELAKKHIGCAMITIEDTTGKRFGKLTASAFLDIHFTPEFSNDNRIPFWGLFKTHETIRPNSALTLFPATGGLVWEDLVNRPYLLACRRIILTESKPTVENWKDMVNFNDLRAFDEADFVH